MKKEKETEQLEKLAAEIGRLQPDLRAEIVIGQCLQNAGIAWNDFFVHQVAGYRRSYSRDLMNAEVSEDSRYRSWLQIYLSRNGLYDILPEGLFFQSETETRRGKSVPEMVQEYRENQKKEQEIRKFFAPVEHEFFLHRLKNEQEESQLLRSLQTGRLTEHFLRFWDMPENLPAIPSLIMILLLPYTHRIVGDLPLTALCLQKILNEPVEARRLASGRQPAAETGNLLGKFSLGCNLVCGDSFEEDYPMIELVLGPLRNSTEHQYLQGGNRYELLQVFFRYFIPAHADIKTTLLIRKEKMKARKMEKGKEPILGISTEL